jgi:hypothetical protein
MLRHLTSNRGSLATDLELQTPLESLKTKIYLEMNNEIPKFNSCSYAF